jgi:hypothetical protein
MCERLGYVSVEQISADCLVLHAIQGLGSLRLNFGFDERRGERYFDAVYDQIVGSAASHNPPVPFLHFFFEVTAAGFNFFHVFMALLQLHLESMNLVDERAMLLHALLRLQLLHYH